MDALLWIGQFLWLAFVGAGALITLVWIGQILWLAFLAGCAFVTTNLFEAMATPDGRHELATGPVGGITAGEGT